MATRAMGPMAGFGWLKNAVNLGRSNPRAIFGGAALVLVAAVVVAIAAALLSGIVVAAAGPGVGSMLAATPSSTVGIFSADTVFARSRTLGGVTGFLLRARALREGRVEEGCSALLTTSCL